MFRNVTHQHTYLKWKCKWSTPICSTCLWMFFFFLFFSSSKLIKSEVESRKQKGKIRKSAFPILSRPNPMIKRWIHPKAKPFYETIWAVHVSLGFFILRFFFALKSSSFETGKGYNLLSAYFIELTCDFVQKMNEAAERENDNIL